MFLSVIHKNAHPRSPVEKQPRHYTYKHASDHKHAAKKKKHTAARSFRLICQHTYTHTHNRVNGLYLPVPYGNITNNIHNLNILYFQPYANLKHIAYFLQGPINSHTRACERHTNTHTNPSEDMCNQDRETEWLSGSTLLICGIFITIYCHHFYGGQHRCSLLEALIS